jgi:hypothetical protein
VKTEGAGSKQSVLVPLAYLWRRTHSPNELSYKKRTKNKKWTKKEAGEAPFEASPLREAILAVDYSQFTRSAGRT